MLQTIISLLALPIGFLGAYIALKRFVKPELILDFSDILLEEITENVEMQKRIYIVGGILGQGIKSGIGLPKATGKFKMEDIVGQLIGGFVQKMFLGQNQNQQQTSNVNTTSSEISKIGQ